MDKSLKVKNSVEINSGLVIAGFPTYKKTGDEEFILLISKGYEDTIN